MRMYDIIEKKRYGKELEAEEINFFINGYCSDNIPDYQASALLMAIFLKEMNERETSLLTEAMAKSGDMVDLSEIEGFKVDKHSTGGVGDKTTLIIGPICAACGIPVAKMSGRGLGHTGGTIDKLESIPGFKTDISNKEFIDNVREIGVSVVGQTGNLAPADKKLYALRDVTATVDNISLIASSIMSKKIASGADGIVLDVKTGSGAFMKTVEKSKKLAELMVKTGNKIGRKTVAIVTDMDVPLGNAIGNSLEVIEAIEVLKGKGPEDLKELSFELAAKMLEVSGLGHRELCIKKVEDAVNNGKALLKFRNMVERQGGNAMVIDQYNLFESSPFIYQYKSKRGGYIKDMRTDALGAASMVLGAGRQTKESTIDYSAGILLNKKKGMKVERDEVIATLYSSDMKKIKEAEDIINKNITFSAYPVQKRPLILAQVN
ncbi:pyrimidine-nucleoside phosphorylase [Herbivorax sp. ANBcel31]|uniref:pyrimidine-nucleoside phosphorylase n=1 Tax=Herbivorax sp. ANBcel31 TaxID=3069754 RepID=UPI0027B8744E|nr:pyrimidine-nucleoside phosphorylase [Herbivorax sp. ANBcel31]MDQ2086199.1 pyrimidine-nucleoside phosphorylase [Herbivorax sp. ANBcel31]